MGGLLTTLLWARVKTLLDTNLQSLGSSGALEIT
jgi:hypothetical protein